MNTIWALIVIVFSLIGWLGQVHSLFPRAGRQSGRDGTRSGRRPHL